MSTYPDSKSDPALEALAEFRRLADLDDEMQKYCLTVDRPWPEGLAGKFWSDVVVHTKPTTIGGVIALIEECVDGAEQPDLLENALAFLRTADRDPFALARASC
jgi:hypothetical protein